MATREEVERIAEEMVKAQPTNFVKMLNNANAGIGYVLKLLYAAKDGCLTAGEISEAMGVSTARVAVLLKKTEKKGLIVKGSHSSDARVTVVRLSEEGKRAANEMKENMLRNISRVVDKVGLEKFRQFIALSVEVKNAMASGFEPMSGDNESQ